MCFLLRSDRATKLCKTNYFSAVKRKRLSATIHHLRGTKAIWPLLRITERAVNRFPDRRIWPLKSARIVDFCGKSSGFADFEYTVDRGSAVNFGADSGFVHSLMVKSWVQNEIWIIDLSSALVGM